jgi:hypothetical protein
MVCDSVLAHGLLCQGDMKNMHPVDLLFFALTAGTTIVALACVALMAIA